MPDTTAVASPRPIARAPARDRPIRVASARDDHPNRASKPSACPGRLGRPSAVHGGRGHGPAARGARRRGSRRPHARCGERPDASERDRRRDRRPDHGGEPVDAAGRARAYRPRRRHAAARASSTCTRTSRGEISANSFIEPVTDTDVDAAYKAVKHARTTLMAGFTTVRDFGGQITVASARRQQRGDVLSPRIVPSRNALGITGGHCDVTGFAPGILEQGPEGRRRRRPLGSGGGRALPDQARRPGDQDLRDRRRPVARGTGGRPAVHLRRAEGDGGRGGAARRQGGRPRPWHRGHQGGGSRRRHLHRARLAARRRSHRS